MKICGIACAIFKEEIDKLKEKGKVKIPIYYIESSLHIYPEKLKSVMSEMITKLEKEFDIIILIYGDCHASIIDWDKKENIKKVKGVNCVEMLLGKKEYRKRRKEKCFFLLPEWVVKWEDIFKNHLGLNEKIGKEIMKEVHDKLVYVDTGIIDVPKKDLDDVSDFTGLNYSIMNINLDILEEKIEECIGDETKDECK